MTPQPQSAALAKTKPTVPLGPARRKPTDSSFLRKIYQSHYQFFQANSPDLPGKLQLEIGSGSGFFSQLQPQVITSELWSSTDVDLQCSATSLPFADRSLAAIYLLDVLHHIKQPAAFFAEAQRSLEIGGSILMVEPANTLFGRYIYQNFHHEVFDPQAQSWELPEGDPRLVANGSLPWILLERDKELFAQHFPKLQLQFMQPCLPLRYLLSGGLSRPQLVPTASYALVAWLEEKLPNWLLQKTGMFYRIRVNKIS